MFFAARMHSFKRDYSLLVLLITVVLLVLILLLVSRSHASTILVSMKSIEIPLVSERGKLYRLYEMIPGLLSWSV